MTFKGTGRSLSLSWVLETWSPHSSWKIWGICERPPISTIIIFYFYCFLFHHKRGEKCIFSLKCVFRVSGRRGVFDGTVENMHLHWKYRELVKIIVNAKNFPQVKKVALALEAESGGVLVSVDKVSKGFAVIVYRGKDYQRPQTLRPKNLLTKRKALARSIELQRREVSQCH